MQTASGILHSLKAKGHRLTNVRVRLIDFFAQNEKPGSVPEIQKWLVRQKIKPNKTTLYREIAFLKDQNIICEVNLSDCKTYYELATREHHHHVVCVRCDNVQDVVVKHDMKRFESKIKRTTDFTILTHSLEFFGVCGDCNP